jgi:hypothetical protein
MHQTREHALALLEHRLSVLPFGALVGKLALQLLDVFALVHNFAWYCVRQTFATGNRPDGGGKGIHCTNDEKAMNEQPAIHILLADDEPTLCSALRLRLCQQCISSR